MRYLRDVVFMGKTQEIIDQFPKDVGEIIKTHLQALQQTQVKALGELPGWVNRGKITDKPLKGGNLDGVRQITIKHRDSYRVMYFAEFEDLIVIIHAFKKKTEGASKKAMETVTKRCAQMKLDRQAGRL